MYSTLLPSCWSGSERGEEVGEGVGLDVTDAVDEEDADKVPPEDTVEESVEVVVEDVNSVFDEDDASCLFKPIELALISTPALVELRLVDREVVGTGTVDESPPTYPGTGTSAGHKLHSPRNASQ